MFHGTQRGSVPVRTDWHTGLPVAGSVTTFSAFLTREIDTSLL